MVRGIRTSNSLYCSNGKVNSYRMAFKAGLGASRKDPTFDPKLGPRGGHTCCKSLVPWRHKADCKHLIVETRDLITDNRRGPMTRTTWGKIKK